MRPNAVGYSNEKCLTYARKTHLCIFQFNIKDLSQYCKNSLKFAFTIETTTENTNKNIKLNEKHPYQNSTYTIFREFINQFYLLNLPSPHKMTNRQKYKPKTVFRGVRYS